MKRCRGFDRNGDGVISAEDLQRHERALGASPGASASRCTVKTSQRKSLLISYDLLCIATEVN